MKKFIILLILTFAIGVIPSIFVGNDVSGLVKPLFFPPKIAFPIVWTIIYILMTISVYIVSKKDDDTYKIYFIQLFVNSLWTVIFFGLNFRLLAFLWLFLLLILVIIMTIKFYRMDKRAGYLLIPYVIWLFFAGYLNLAIYILNR